MILKFTHVHAHIYSHVTLARPGLLSKCQCPGKAHELTTGLQAKRSFGKLKVTVQFLYREKHFLLAWTHGLTELTQVPNPGVPEVNGNHLSTLNGLQDSPKNDLQ